MNRAGDRICAPAFLPLLGLSERPRLTVEFCLGQCLLQSKQYPRNFSI
jgi:hypothetical protein